MLARSVVVAGALALLASSPVGAAKPGGLSGTIDLMASQSASVESAAAEEPTPAYGDDVSFETTIEGRISSKGRVYVTVLCWQDGDIVYQYSGDRDASFPLLDQAGQGLEWDGGDANCEAWLIYRVEKGKSAEITNLDMVAFDVTGA